MISEPKLFGPFEYKTLRHVPLIDKVYTLGVFCGEMYLGREERAYKF